MVSVNFPGLYTTRVVTFLGAELLYERLFLSVCLSTPIYGGSYYAVTTDIQLAKDRKHNFNFSIQQLSQILNNRKHFFKLLKFFYIQR